MAYIILRFTYVFEQRYFFDDDGILKSYNHEVDDENILYMLEILQYAGADTELRKAIEIELRSNRLWDEEIVKRDLKITEQQQALEESAKVIEESAKVIEESAKALEEKEKENEELRQLVVMLKSKKSR